MGGQVQKFEKPVVFQKTGLFQCCSRGGQVRNCKGTNLSSAEEIVA